MRPLIRIARVTKFFVYCGSIQPSIKPHKEQPGGPCPLLAFRPFSPVDRRYRHRSADGDAATHGRRWTWALRAAASPCAPVPILSHGGWTGRVVKRKNVKR